MEILKSIGMTKVFGGKSNLTVAIDQLDLVIDSGEFVTIMGPSGSGKTTLFNLLSTIDQPTEGEIYIEGQKTTEMRNKALEKFRHNKIGFIFQNYHLLNTLTVYENIALPLTLRREKVGLIDGKVMAMAEKLSIENILKKYPYELSGGEKQRVAIGRALITDPAIVFADEPTGALDSKNAFNLLTLLKELNEKEKVTILMVTHDPFAASFGTRAVFLKDGKFYNTLYKGVEDKKTFFNKIVKVSTMLGGNFDVIEVSPS